MRIELENTGGISHYWRENGKYWADRGLSAEYIGSLCGRWGSSLDVIVESFPLTPWRKPYYHVIHWFVEADLGEFVQWAMQEYDTELVLATENGTVTVEIYDDYRE